MTLRQRSYLTESKKILKGFPSKTFISGHKNCFSSWDGKLALVTSSSNFGSLSYNQFALLFYPDEMLSRHDVRFVIAPGGKTIPAERSFIDVEPNIDYRGKSYEKRSFAIGNIECTFSEPSVFWVKKRLKDLEIEEVRFAESYFLAKKFIDASHYELRSKLSSKVWKIVIGMTFDEIQDKMSYKEVNEVDRVVTHLLGRHAKNDREANKIWKSFKGVFALNRGQNKIKFVVKR